MAIAVMQVHLRLPQSAVVHHASQWAAMCAQLVSAFSDVTQDALRTGMTGDSRGGISRDLFSARIPVGDTPIQIDEVHAVLDLLQDRAVTDSSTTTSQPSGTSMLPALVVCIHDNHWGEPAVARPVPWPPKTLGHRSPTARAMIVSGVSRPGPAQGIRQLLSRHAGRNRTLCPFAAGTSSAQTAQTHCQLSANPRVSKPAAAGSDSNRACASADDSADPGSPARQPRVAWLRRCSGCSRDRCRSCLTRCH